MSTTARMIEVERWGGILVLTPWRDLREWDFQEIEAERDEVLRLLEHDPSLRNLVVDFEPTSYFGSTTAWMLARLWQRVRTCGGHMALCNLSARERDMLAVTGLAGLWPVFPSREEAMQAVGGGVRAA